MYSRMGFGGARVLRRSKVSRVGLLKKHNFNFINLFSRYYTFYGERALSDFVNWLAFNRENTKAICFFHFGGYVIVTSRSKNNHIFYSGYDYIHILGEILRLGHCPSKIITRNLRILHMTIGCSVRCRDSFNIFRYYLPVGIITALFFIFLAAH